MQEPAHVTVLMALVGLTVEVSYFYAVIQQEKVVLFVYLD